jgi:rhodanese-related sulfurtransferase
MNINSITAAQLSELYLSGRPVELIDVRTPGEYREVHVAAARNVPLDQLDPSALIKARIDSDNGPLYLICKIGGRSARACALFIEAGFANVVNVEGGTIACVDAGLPIVRARNR